MRKLLPLAVALVAALSGSARADRAERAENNFKSNCVGCHSLGWGAPVPAERATRPAIDLTLITRRLDEQALREFLQDPTRRRPGTGCQHVALERSQVDDLVAFLTMHAEGPPPTRQVVPPRTRFRKMSDPPVRTGTAKNRGTAPTAATPAAGGGR